MDKRTAILNALHNGPKTGYQISESIKATAGVYLAPTTIYIKLRDLMYCQEVERAGQEQDGRSLFRIRKTNGQS